MDAAVRPTGQVPEHPGVHRSEGQLGPRLDTALGEQPLELGGREIGIENQARALPHQRQIPGVPKGVAPAGGAAVLPHERPMERSAAAAIPCHGRLPLVGHADGRDRLVPVGQLGGDGRQHMLHAAPDLVGVVLDPTGSGVVLGQLPIGSEHRRSALVHGQRPHARGAGVDGEHDRHGVIRGAAAPTASWSSWRRRGRDGSRSS